jgi:hypothetical protein
MAGTAIETVTTRAYRPDEDPWMAAATPGAKASYRADGWTPLRQQVFLRSIAEGRTVELACSGVGLSVQSAYAFRNRAGGAAFALGWAAARLLARERIADTLLTRALHGQLETATRSDGVTVDRLKYDNRLAMGLLTRLDRQAEGGHAGAQAARLVAQEFEAFTDAIARDDSPARAGLFLGTRAVGEAEAELAPVIALARAERFARTGAALATEVDVSDLDLTARADWTADQWQRAEAAGLLRVSPSPSEDAPEAGSDEEDPDEEIPFSPLQLPQLREVEPPVWEAPGFGLVTDFPPPDNYDGQEFGHWGEEDYMRFLTPEEEAAWYLRPLDADDEAIAQARITDAEARDRFFGFLSVEPAPDAEPTGPEPGMASAPASS